MNKKRILKDKATGRSPRTFEGEEAGSTEQRESELENQKVDVSYINDVNKGFKHRESLKQKRKRKVSPSPPTNP